MPSLRAAMLLLAAFVSSPAAAARPPTGELTLDMADPIVVAAIAGVKLRLRVELDAKNVVELNPAAAARLPVAFAPGFVAQVGRVTLPGTGAIAEVAIEGRRFGAQLASHGRDCCAGADGAIGPMLLPYARIRFVRRNAPSDLPPRSFAMEATADGLEYAEPASGGLRIQFSLERPETTATSSAGAMLAASYRGRLVGGYQDVATAFGVMRPTRMMTLATPATIAGFGFDRLRVRTADFGGGYELPHDAAAPGDIVVRKRVRPQEAVPIVLIGRDRLDSCSEIMFDTRTRRLDMRCRFE